MHGRALFRLPAPGDAGNLQYNLSPLCSLTTPHRFMLSTSNPTRTPVPDKMGPQALSWVILFLPALALTTSFGPGLTELAVLLGTVAYSKQLWQKRRALFHPANAVIAAFAFNLVAAVVSLLMTRFQLRSIDNPVRELLVLAVVGLIVLHKPKSEMFWFGLFAGTIGAAGLALFQRLSMGLERAGGFNLSIMFGDIAVAMGLMALASINLFSRTRLAAVPYIAFLAGLLASVLSGSRGGWISLAVCMIPLYAYAERETRRRLAFIFGAGLVLFATTLAIPQLRVIQRFSDVLLNVNQYMLGNVDTSVGARFEMWKGAWQMFVEHPLMGVGRGNFNEGLNALVARHVLDPAVHIYYHAHNDILQALSTEGLVGIAALAALYIAPLRFFMQSWRRHDAAQPFALAGILLVVSYVISGLTQVLFSHHLGTAFYAATVGVLVGLCISNQAAGSPDPALVKR